MTGRPRRVPVWSASPARALLEGWLLGGLLYLGIVSQWPKISAGSPTSGIVLATGVAALWAALRMRYAADGAPTRRLSRLRAWWREGLIAAAFGVAVAGGWTGVLALLGWGAVAVDALGPATHNAALLATAGYLLALRIGFGVWRYWRDLGRRHLHWAIANTHAELVLLLATLFALALTAAQVAGGYIGVPVEGGGALASVLQDLVFSVFPVVGMAAALGVGALVVLLPPAAVLSYRTARRTTRRLAELVRAAERVRRGDYTARAPVEGEDEVASLQDHFNAMAAELERALAGLAAERDQVAGLLAERRELVAKVSHELRTPVATLRGHLERLLVPDAEGPGAPSPVEVEAGLRVMEGEVLRLQRLIDDLFTLSRAEAGGLALSPAPTDLVALAGARVEAMAPLAWAQARVEIVLDAPEGAVVARVDPGRMDQILTNLLRNAARHTPPGGIVSVRVRNADDAAVVVVRDTGEGIPPEELPRVWERFYRGDAARHRDGGAGLGLALVKELTEAMGGTASVRSRPGVGTAFALRLPRA